VSTNGDHGGVITELVRGEWVDPITGSRPSIPIEDIVIRTTLDGAEAELVAARHGGQSLTIVSDRYTHEALGARVRRALEGAGVAVREHVWERPVCSAEGVEAIRAATGGTDAVIAVGSGTINDTVKYACFLDDRPYSVFPTSPMNAYTTGTASVSFDGFKHSITCRGAKGVFFDLSVLARCPPRLISAAFADVICRTTAQVDWLLSHLLLGTPYVETPYTLLAIDEGEMIARAGDMRAEDVGALALLTRISAIMGLGTSFSETTHSGSMHEHMISHYIDMFAGEAHPGSSHGEQVGVASVTMSALQNETFGRESPPRLRATDIPEARLRERFSSEMADKLVAETRAKALTEATADALNERLDRDWPELRARIAAAMLPFETLRGAMRAAGCQTTATELGLAPDFYREAVADARWIRDRFGTLDFVGDGPGLDGFVRTMPL